jgi:hypothetical protein
VFANVRKMVMRLKMRTTSWTLLVDMKEKEG